METLEELEEKLSTAAKEPVVGATESEYRIIQKKIYYRKNSEKVNQLCRDHYEQNKDTYKQRHRKYYQDYKDKQKEWSKKWASENVEKLKAYQKEYYLKNKEKIKKQEKMRSATPEHKERVRIYKQNNRPHYRATDYRRRYGISIDDYNTLFQTQNGCCAICKRPESEVVNTKYKHLHVDHCHKTGNVRGLLCPKCNALLGSAVDSVDILSSAIVYLNNSAGA